MKLKSAEGLASMVSVSGDCIYTPATHTSRWSIKQQARQCLERRMPGFAIAISDINGLGINFYAVASIPVDDDIVELKAVCSANSSTMSVKTVDLLRSGKQVTVSPTLVDMIPEDAYSALHRIARNLYHYE